MAFQPFPSRRPSSVSQRLLRAVALILCIAFLLQKYLKMDPVTAISLACNAIQLVETSCKVVGQARKIYAGKGTEDSKTQDLISVTEDLEGLTDLLTRELLQTVNQTDKLTVIQFEPPQGRSPDSNVLLRDDVKLRMLCEGCKATAQELTKVLDNHRVEVKGTRKRDQAKAAAGSLRAAIRKYWDEEQLEELNSRLHNYRGELILRLLMYTRDGVEHLRLGQIEAFRTLNQDLKDLVRGQRTFTQDLIDNQSRVLINTNSARFDRTDDTLGEILMHVSRMDPFENHAKGTHSVIEATQIPDVDETLEAGREEKGKESLPIIDAVKQGDLSRVRGLIRRDPTAARAFDEDHMTCLHHACAAGRLDLASYLYRNGAQINADDDTGKLPLHFAVVANAPALIRMLLKKGADDGAADNFDRKPLDYAKPGGEAEWILKWGPDLFDRNDEDLTAIHHFSREGKLDIIRSLLNQKVDANRRAKDKVTALMLAAENDHCDLIRLLIEYGANPDLTNDRGDTALGRAAWAGQVSAVREMIKHASNIDAANDLWYTPLNEAAFHGHAEVVDILLAAGADGEHMNSHWGGHRPLQQAGQQAHYGVALALLDKGVSVNSTSGVGWTCLIEASKANNPAIVDLCLKRGANPNTRTTCHEGTFALREAIIFNKPEHFDLLMADSRTDLELRDAQGRTVLHWAVGRGNDDMVASLLKAGASIDGTNPGGDDLLTTALKHGHMSIAQQLRDFGVTI